MENSASAIEAFGISQAETRVCCYQHVSSLGCVRMLPLEDADIRVAEIKACHAGELGAPVDLAFL